MFESSDEPFSDQNYVVLVNSMAGYMEKECNVILLATKV